MPAKFVPIGQGSIGRGARVLVLSASLAALAACASNNTSHHTSNSHAAPATAIGVNGYLWRATLDTLAFMPLPSADPYGGVVITDWYVNPEKPDERFKATVYILDTRLRADGLNVTVFKEISNGAGGWTAAPTAAQTSTDIENAILTRARQLRLSNLNGLTGLQPWPATIPKRSSPSGAPPGTAADVFRADNRSRSAQILCAGDVPLSVGAPAHGPCAQLRHGRRGRPLQARARLQRAAPHGLGRLRPAGRERRHGARRRSGGLDLRQHRRHARRAEAAGPVDRLVARVRHLRSGLLRPSSRPGSWTSGSGAWSIARRPWSTGTRST